MRTLLPDLTPLRTNAAYRRLWVGFALAGIGAQLATVAIGLRVYDLTGSSAAVGLVGLFALVPLVVLGLYGGALACSRGCSSAGRAIGPPTRSMRSSRRLPCGGLLTLGPIPPERGEGPQRRGVRSVIEGFGSLRRSPNVRMTFISDIFAMVLAQPRVLLPAAGIRATSLAAFDDHDNAVSVTTVWSAGPGRPGLIESMGFHRDHRGRGYGVAITVAAASALRQMGS